MIFLLYYYMAIPKSKINIHGDMLDYYIMYTLLCLSIKITMMYRIRL